jgi:hypothetical protein
MLPVHLKVHFLWPWSPVIFNTTHLREHFIYNFKNPLKSPHCCRYRTIITRERRRLNIQVDRSIISVNSVTIKSRQTLSVYYNTQDTVVSWDVMFYVKHLELYLYQCPMAVRYLKNLDLPKHLEHTGYSHFLGKHVRQMKCKRFHEYPNR